MPEITNLPILTEATAETYLITVDNGIAKRLPLGGVGQIKGDIGYTGSTGITGYTGSVSTIPGYTGSRGYTGSTGYAGSRGAYDAIGFTGSQGYVGSRGPANMLNATAGTADTLEYFVGVSQPNAEVTPVISVNHSIVFNPGRGLVGIGTQTPSGTLHLKSAQTPELYFEQGTTSTQHKIYSTGGTFNIDIDTNNTRGGSYFYINQVGAKKITVDPRGFLGAGTSDPAEQLDVRGRIKVSSTSSLVGTDLSYGRFFAQQGGIPGIPNAFPGSGGNIFVENQVWTGASTTNPSYAGSLIVGTTKVDNGYTGVLDIWVTSTATAVSNQFNNWVQALEVQKKGVDVFRDLKVWGNLEVDGYYFRDGAAATSHITTFAPEMHIAEFTATTVILGLAATTLTMGASIDAPYNIATINNPTVRGANATQNLWDTVALTVNAFGAASTLNMGAGSGVATLRNPTLVGVNGTQNVYDTVANNVFAFGAATALNLGSGAPGVATIRNPIVRGVNSTQYLWDTTATTIYFGGEATRLNMGSPDHNSIALIRNPTVVGSSSTQYLWDTTATSIYFAGSATTLFVGSSTGVATIRNPAVGGVNTTQYLWNGTATSVYFAGSATTLFVGSSTGVATIRNPAVGGVNDTQYLWDGTATNVYFAGSATTLFVGSSTGIATIRNPAVGGVNDTQYLWDGTATNVYFAGSATTLFVGSSTGIATVRNPVVVGVNSAQYLWNTVATTVHFAGAASVLTIATDSPNPASVTIGNAAGTVYIPGNLQVLGSTTYLETTNTAIKDSLLELHTSFDNSGNITNLTTDDLADIGLRLHYYNGGNQNAGLIMAHDTRFLEWYVSGAETVGSPDIFNGVYGTFKTGAIQLVGGTGADVDLQVAGKARIGSDIYANGNVTIEGGSILTDQLTFNIVNTTATTVNIAGAATTLNLGSTTGSTVARNNLTVTNALAVLGSSTVATAFIGNLHSGRVTYATTGSQLTDSPNLTFDGTRLSANILLITNTATSTSTNTGALQILGGLGVGGSIYAGGDVYSAFSSDARLKTNVVNIPNAVNKILQLNGVTFNWNDLAVEQGKNTTNAEAGVIAQEVQAVLPEVVAERENGYLAVRYEKLVPLLIEAIKEQQGTITQLQSDLDALVKKLGF